MKKEKYNISQLRLSETKIPVRAKLAFVELCRAQSKHYPPYSNGGPKLSAARFYKEAAKEKLIKLGVDIEYIKLIT
jgi:hypothetical protein